MDIIKKIQNLIDIETQWCEGFTSEDNDMYDENDMEDLWAVHCSQTKVSAYNEIIKLLKENKS